VSRLVAVRSRCGTLGRHLHARRVKRTHHERGDTLVEVLIAIVIIGLTAGAILGAFATTISASGEQRSLAGADAFLRSFVEKATYDISLRTSPAPAFVPCPTGIPSAYSTIASNYSNSTYTIMITAVTPVESGTCTTSAALPQQITATLSAPGVTDSTVFVVSQPNAVVASITTTVTSITPDFGPVAGGTSVTITGVGFTGATAVNFGSTPATNVSVANDTTITATSPPGTGAVDVTVVTPAGTSPTNALDLFNYAPTVTSVAPTSGPATGGTSVTITGTGFTGATAVTFGSTPAASYNVTASTSITAISPAGSPGQVDVTVTTAAGTSLTTSADTFTYRISVTGVAPNSGPLTGGTVVNVLGAGFTGATAVKFGSTLATSFTVNSDASITATSPPGTGTVDITVTGPSGTSATGPADQFTYSPTAPIGLGLALKNGAGSGTPKASCHAGTGTSCSSSSNHKRCMMTGTTTSTTCDIANIWGNSNSGTNPATAVFYVETVDAAGDPTTYSTAVDLNLSVSSATPATITIPANSTSTNPNVITATLTAQNNTTTVVITGGGWTLTVVVSG
jgi:Tfp pilus assembly protein PilV